MMKWNTEVRGEHRILHSGQFRILQTSADVALEHPKMPVLFYPNVDMAKRIAGYLHQGGLTQ